MYQCVGTIINTSILQKTPKTLKPGKCKASAQTHSRARNPIPATSNYDTQLPNHSTAPGPQGGAVFLPPPGTRPPGGTPPPPAPQGPRNGFQQQCPLRSVTSDPSSCTPRPTGQRAPVCTADLPALTLAPAGAAGDSREGPGV